MVNRKKTVKKEARKQLKSSKAILIENAELLSKDQLKKVMKNPKTNIRPSGKRRRKMLKRLRHSEKEKNTMQVDMSEVAASTSKIQSAEFEAEMIENQSSDESDQDVQMKD